MHDTSPDAVQSRLVARVRDLAARHVITPWQALAMELRVALARARVLAAIGAPS